MINPDDVYAAGHYNGVTEERARIRKAQVVALRELRRWVALMPIVGARVNMKKHLARIDAATLAPRTKGKRT